MPSTWIKMLKIWYASDKEIFRYSHLTSREKSLAVSSKMHLQALHHEGQDHLTLYRLGLSNPPSTTTKRTKGIKGPSFSCMLGMLVQKLKLNNKLSNYWGSKCRIHSERPRWTLLLAICATCITMVDGPFGSSSINAMDSEESHYQGKRQWPKPGHALCQTSAGILAKDSETSPQFFFVFQLQLVNCLR